jgi:hypothetical protein
VPRPTARCSATSAQHTFTQAYAWWIRLNAPSLGCELAETHNVLVDVTNTNGAMLSTYDSGDGTHPNDAGHQKMAVEVAKALKRLTARVSPYAIVGAPGIFNVFGDTLNARAAVIGTGWFEQGGGTGTAPTYSFVNDTSSQLVAGRWAQMDFDGTASGGVRRLASSVTAGASTFAVGDLILATAKFQIEDTSGTWQTDVVAHNATATFTAVNQSAAAIPNGSAGTGCAGVLNAAGFYDFQVAFVFPVPAATTQILPWYSLTVPTGKHYKMRVGEPTRGCGRRDTSRPARRGAPTWKPTRPPSTRSPGAGRTRTRSTWTQPSGLSRMSSPGRSPSLSLIRPRWWLDDRHLADHPGRGAD